MGKQVVAGLNGGLAQLGEHLPCKQGVESSNLLVSTKAISEAYESRGNCFKLEKAKNRTLKTEYRRSKSKRL